MRRNALLAIGLLIILLLAVNIVSDALLRRARVDLTAQNLYTLTSGTRSILRDLDEPITLTLFYSESLAEGRPGLQSYGQRVRELLQEYRLRSGGAIELEFVDPEPFSEAEDRAAREGLQAVPISASEQFYFGIVGVNSTDGREVIGFLDPGQERFLEYQLTQLIYRLAHPERPKVVVLSSLNLDGGGPQLPGMPPEMTRPWQIMRELRELFDVEVIEASAAALPEDLDLLLVVHPKQLAEPTLRAIDAWVIGGGATIVCVDPLCEMDIPLEAMQNPLARFQADRTSNLNALLGEWGVTIGPDQVVGDMALAAQVPSEDRRSLVPYLPFLVLDEENFNDDEAVSRGLGQMRMVLSGAIEHDDAVGTSFTPLVTTSDQTMLIDKARVTFPDPQALVADFAPSGTVRTLAARIGGAALSAFASEADGPESPQGAAPEAGAEGDDAAGADPAPVAGEINLVVIADVDFLSDQMWVQEIRLGGAVLGYQKLSDNVDFLLNAIEQMAGSSALISVRARGEYARPFTYVEQLRRQANERYLAEAEALEAEQRQTQQRLNELQRQRPDDGGSLILTPEQEAELDRLQERMIETRAQLRQVNYNLRKDVENLGRTLKIINIGAAPALVALGAIGLGAYRTARRRQDRRTMAGEG